VSPWHDVPLHADAAKGLLNFICEIPKESKAKARRGARWRAQYGRGSARGARRDVQNRQVMRAQFAKLRVQRG
jgi:hypothetical protein